MEKTKVENVSVFEGLMLLRSYSYSFDVEDVRGNILVGPKLKCLLKKGITKKSLEWLRGFCGWFLFYDNDDIRVAVNVPKPIYKDCPWRSVENDK